MAGNSAQVAALPPGARVSRRRLIALAAIIGIAITGMVGASSPPAQALDPGPPNPANFPLVTATATLNGRAAPWVTAPWNNAEKFNAFPKGVTFPVSCYYYGDRDRPGGTTLYYRSLDGYFVSSSFVTPKPRGLPSCTEVLNRAVPAITPYAHLYRVSATLNGYDYPGGPALKVDAYPSGRMVQLQCWIYRSSELYDLTNDGYFVKDRYVKTGRSGPALGLPKCPSSYLVPRTRVVALGDSFGSGEGTGTYDTNTNFTQVNTCHRSRYSWQRMTWIPGKGVSDYLNPNIIYVQKACSGATLRNVWDVSYGLGDSKRGAPNQGDEADQILAVNYRTSHIWLSIGGNDLDFAGAMVDCVESYCVRNKSRLTEARDKINRDALSPALRKLLTELHRRAPSAQIVLAGYPELSVQGNVKHSPNPLCRSVGRAGLDADEKRTIDSMSRGLHDRTKRLVSGLPSSWKVSYADTVASFQPRGESHGACSTANWITSPRTINLRATNPKQQLFHPNVSGQGAYLRAVNPLVR